MVDAPFGRKRGDEPPMTEQEMRDVISFLATLTDERAGCEHCPAK
jgi:cytochrome c peroxidase